MKRITKKNRKTKLMSKRKIDKLNAIIAVRGITRKEIALSINRSYNTVCLVLKRKRHSNNILNQIEAFVRSKEKYEV